MNIFQVFWDFIVNSGFAHLFDIRITENGIENGEIIMIAVSCVLIYLAIGKGFEPLLLLPISFGMLLANLPLSGLMNPEFFSDPKGNLDIAEILSHGGLFDILYRPAITPVMKRASLAGCRVSNGYKMLEYQAYAQYKLFTGQDFEVDSEITGDII